MHKPTVNVVKVEQWNIAAQDKTKFPDGRKVVTKVAVRVAKGRPGGGQFHGATNFRGSVL